MLMDRELAPTTLAGQSPTTGTQFSTDVIDAGVALNINTNRELQVILTVTTAFAGGTSMEAQLVESDNSDLSSPDVLATSGVITEANLTAGTRLLDQALPTTSKRYIGFRFITVGTHSAGTVVGGLVRDIDDTAFPTQNTGYVA